VLLRAKERGLIVEITPLLDELVAKQCWLGQDLIAEALRLAGE
jgi:predicted nucleic acid-binding protein